jgi:tRNA pseudouridine38-40 synthase
MPRFRLLIEYAGTRYSGWQIQKNARTIQGEIDRAVREVSGRREFELYGSGRTDAGVHALAQVAHLELYTDLPPESLRRKINDELPADIHIRAIDKVAHRFHARHDAVSRSYLYQISRRRSAFAKPYVWWIRETLDLDAMRDAARSFVGVRNFEAFTADDPEEKSTHVLVERVEIAEAGALVLVRVQGSHFLWKMVRRMVGVLAACGQGALSASEAGGFLDPIPPAGASNTAPRNRESAHSGRAGRDQLNPAALAAPASGLFLEAVLYKGDAGPGPIRPVMTVE